MAADDSKPFAFFVGFHKPHPFWDVPQRLQDEYLETVPLPTNTDAPTDMPDVAYYSCTSVNTRSDIGGKTCDNTTLNPDNCSYIMPNASYATKVGLQRVPPTKMRKIRAGYAAGMTHPFMFSFFFFGGDGGGWYFFLLFFFPSRCKPLFEVALSPVLNVC